MSEPRGNASYTKSFSDVESEGDRRARRSRRKRGHNRYRRCEMADFESSSAVEDAETKRKRRNGERLGMAPSNTTQFLLEDREARAEAEQEVGVNCDTVERRRIRSLSCGSDKQKIRNCKNEADQCTSSESEDELEKDREFEEQYEEVKLERIVQMSKEELAQELLDRDRDTESLHDRCEKIDSENRHLKELLSANGIPYEQSSGVSSSVNHASKSPRVPAN